MTTQQSAAYFKRWKYDADHGNYRTTPTEPVRLHIATLEGAGWSLRAIAGAAGVSPQLLTHVRSGQRSMRKVSAAKILAVRADTLPKRPSHQTTEPFVPRVGTVRRIQALMTIGWSCKAMAEHLTNGQDERWLHNKLNQQGRWVRRSTHDEVARLYRDLSTRPGPSEIARTRARLRGLAGPLDWDDIDHDAEPERDLEQHGIGKDVSEWRPASEGILDRDECDDAVVRRLVDEGARLRTLTHAEAAAAYAELRARGVSTTEIERRYGLNSERYHREERAS